MKRPTAPDDPKLRHLYLDFNGTLAKDGRLRPGVAARLRKLAKRLKITVVTSDTFGTARRILRRLPSRSAW